MADIDSRSELQKLLDDKLVYTGMDRANSPGCLIVQAWYHMGEHRHLAWEEVLVGMVGDLLKQNDQLFRDLVEQKEMHMTPEVIFLKKGEAM